MDKNEVLQEIFNSDPMGLLTVKPKKSSAPSSDERLLSSFEEINDFFEKNNREPQPNTGNISEHMLYSRLKAFRKDEEKTLALSVNAKSFDKLLSQGVGGNVLINLKIGSKNKNVIIKEERTGETGW